MSAQKDFSLGSFGGGVTLGYGADFWDTMRAYWADLAKQDVTAYSNIPAGAKMLAKIATGRFRVDEYGGTSWSTGGELLALNGNIIPEGRSQFAIDWPALTFSVNAGAMTCNLKTTLGADATATLPITVPFRSGTLTIGQTYARQLTAAHSLVISSGATMAATSAVGRWLYFYMMDYNTGTLELAVSATNYGNYFIGTSVAMSGSATSGSAIYSTTARTSVPMTLIGQVFDTQSSAGTYAATPSEVRAGQGASPTIKSGVVGDVVGNVSGNLTGNVSGNVTLPVSKPVHSATPTFDFSLYSAFYPEVVTANITSMAVTNLPEGRDSVIRFKMNGTGGFSIALPSGSKVGGWYGTLANQVSDLVLRYNSVDARVEAQWVVYPV